MVVFGEDLTLIFCEFRTISDGFVNIVLHVKLEQVVLPHKNVASLVNGRVEGHFGVFCNVNAFLESVFHCKNVSVHELKGCDFLVQKEVKICV